MLSVAEAQTILLADVGCGPAEIVRLSQSLGRTLRESILNPRDMPPFDKALMDGFAIRAEDFQSSSHEFRVLEMIAAGTLSESVLRAGDSVQIMTGAPLPDSANAVVPVEQSELAPDRSTVKLSGGPVPAGQNVMPRATLMRSGDTLLEPGRVLRPQEIALLAECGYDRVEVAKPPSVAILATGDELVSAGETPGPGQIVNSNAPMLAAQVELSGGIPRPLGIARDDREHLMQLVRTGLEQDFLILSGGVSAGERDLVPGVLAECGVVRKFHKVQLKPGKPIWCGSYTNGLGKTTYVFGTPGNPVSGMVCFELFIRPVLRRYLGQTPSRIPPICVPLHKAHVARGGRPTYHPARLHWTTEGASVEAVPWKGSSDLRATTWANCLICFPAGDRAYQVGEPVDVHPWNGVQFEFV
jgi:molybdopterin molybdotransferase